MKKIVKYQDDRGQEWDTEEQALQSDAEYALNLLMQDYVIDGKFNTKMWILDNQTQPAMMLTLRTALKWDINSKPKSTGMWKDNKYVGRLRCGGKE